MQPMEATTDDGDTAPGWDLSPYQAMIGRDKARKRYSELLTQKAKLLSLLVQRTEVDIEQKIAVVSVQGVDFDTWKRGRPSG